MEARLAQEQKRDHRAAATQLPAQPKTNQTLKTHLDRLGGDKAARLEVQRAALDSACTAQRGGRGGRNYNCNADCNITMQWPEISREWRVLHEPSAWRSPSLPMIQQHAQKKQTDGDEQTGPALLPLCPPEIAFCTASSPSTTSS